jgi:hypothetical protein
VSDRHHRQTRLREIGEEGQRRIGAATAVVASRGASSMVEARYLAGAGFARVVVVDAASEGAARAVDPDVVVERRHVDASPEAFPLERELADPSARAVAEGAYRALCAVKAALRGETR